MTVFFVFTEILKLESEAVNMTSINPGKYKLSEKTGKLTAQGKYFIIHLF